ncbi:glutamyl-tRNA(Gln) amidotransferase subunit A [Variibacter gotjawalensis]|uniref:Glutamyl-tRNA(Gln) amidotransferase subunit A n=1 Tax=Variibacter gotjawalensis TaxID=1333996 RepID=A0A0S3PY23_9BRAD|nr:amidase [Variibacter gotjawalensis]NIK46505.1 Asp-tRNA(Asn)/Glu-tRNA(Gln) amidotransferase A subunit family amidase [Variibacter gotjawalensis]RZS48413.1 amidase [Variibacter gotjawalensis]BAT60672.1 glutamyl-tRNA(Gln) amidotransferase subunit A [Variibacter gotjawalensis]
MEPHRLSATEAALLIAEQKLTSEALTASCLERIEARNADVKAVVAFDRDKALSEARKRDQAPGGILNGIPFLAKDVIDTADYPTAYGSPIYTNHRPVADASVIAQMRERGSVLLGKAATAEFATRHPAEARNPLRLTHTPGGSSSGSAAAVADFMAPYAFGTQTTGSIIRPASYCGIVGYKPSFGTFSVGGVRPVSPAQDTVGLLVRSVSDAALVTFGIADLAGRAEKQPMPRFAVCRSSQWDHAHKDLRADIEALAGKLGNRRAPDVTLDADFEQTIEDQEHIFAYEVNAIAAHERATAPHLISKALTERMARGAAIDLAAFLDMQKNARAARQRVDTLFANAEILIYPATEGEAEEGIAWSGSARFCALWTLMHMPTITIPLGLGPTGMPWGVQLIARFGDDMPLLIAAEKLAKLIAR